MERFTNNSGISLVEVVLAIAIFSFVVAGLFRIEWGISDLVFGNDKRILAENWANSNILRVLSDLPLTTGFKGMTNNLTHFPFSKCLSVVTAKSEWKSIFATTTTETSALIPNIAMIYFLGADCGGNPKKFDETMFHLIGSTELGYPVTDIDVWNGNVYVSLRGSVSDPGIAIVRIDNSQPVAFIDQVNAINSIDVNQNGICVAQNSSTTQATILTGLNYQNTSTSTLPGVSGQRPEGFSVFSYDQKMFIGTKRTAGNEFHVLDTSPGNLTWLGSKEMNHNINGIEVQNNTAYLATSGNVKDLIVLDVTQPSNMREIISVDLPGNEDGKSIFVAGDYIFLGRYKSTSLGHNELQILKIQRDENDRVIGVTSVTSASVGGDVNGLVFAHRFIYVANSNLNKELQVFEFDRHGLSLSLVGSYDLPANATSIDIEGDDVVVGAGSKIYFYKNE